MEGSKIVQEIELVGSPGRVYEAYTDGAKHAEFTQLATRLDEQRRVGFQCIASPGNWCEFDEFGALLLPQAMIQGVVACLI